MKIWLISDPEGIETHAGWVGPEDIEIDMEYATDLYYTTCLYYPSKWWDEIQEKLADRIQKWGGEIEYVDDFYHWLDKRQQHNNSLELVTFTDEPETKELAKLLSSKFLRKLKQDQTEFFDVNEFPADVWK